MKSDFKTEFVSFLETICAIYGFEVEFNMPNHHEDYVVFPDFNLRLTLRYLHDNACPHSKNRPQEAMNNIQIWEDLWINKRAKIESKIKSLLGITQKIHGRETRLIKLNNKQLISFLDTNHLHTPIKGKYKYGLQFKDKLVAVMSFSNSRLVNRAGVDYNSFELLRFCNKLDYTVVGGFSKLLKHFISLHHPDDIMTYVDADWSRGTYMHSFGFIREEFKPPLEFWYNQKTGEREYPHRVLKMHEKSMELLRNEELESNYLNENNYIKIYNSGSYKLLLKLK